MLRGRRGGARVVPSGVEGHCARHCRRIWEVEGFLCDTVDVFEGPRRGKGTKVRIKAKLQMKKK